MTREEAINYINDMSNQYSLELEAMDLKDKDSFKFHKSRLENCYKKICELGVTYQESDIYISSFAVSFKHLMAILHKITDKK